MDFCHLTVTCLFFLLKTANSLAHILFQAVTIYPWLYTVIIARIQYIEDVRQVRPIKPL